MTESYENPGPSREDIDATTGSVLLEFGTGWCGHCQAAAAPIAALLADSPSVQHIKVEDGPGRKLGRSFGVKLWPTLICLKNGVEVARVVRPETEDHVRTALSRIL